MDLFKDIEPQIQILTCHSDVLRKKFKSYVQVNTPGGEPVIMFSPEAMQKTRLESLEVLVESLRKAVETNEMAALISAREALDKDFEG